MKFNELFPLSAGRSYLAQLEQSFFRLIKSTHFFILAVCSLLKPIGVEKKLIFSHPGFCRLDSQSKKLQVSKTYLHTIENDSYDVLGENIVCFRQVYDVNF